eukprot:XP_027304694.1 uncharacterized protein LOC110354585 isoform X5 [Anas platyrhynchos]
MGRGTFPCSPPPPPRLHFGIDHVERTESEQGLLSIVLLVLLQRNCNPKTSQNLKMIYQPSLTIWVSQKLFPTSPRNGGFPKIKMQIAAL